ncbi:MAG: sigma-70 family RNA polymerase sigma factor [Myxococcaceae bacterium]|nr:sigma-70 family RNA polymerase sigma factor [Myxococcaceae bacterium]
MSPPSFLQSALEHLPALLRVGRRWTGQPSDAEDLAQDTLMRALERQGELRDAASMKAWLLTIQRTVFLNGRRGQRPRLEVLEGGRSSAPEAVGDLEAELLRSSLDDELLAALEGLQPEWREALWLREVEELSYEEIAMVQGCPVGTVRSRLARARTQLLAALEPEEVKRARL